MRPIPCRPRPTPSYGGSSYYPRPCPPPRPLPPPRPVYVAPQPVYGESCDYYGGGYGYSDCYSPPPGYGYGLGGLVLDRLAGNKIEHKDESYSLSLGPITIGGQPAAQPVYVEQQPVYAQPYADCSQTVQPTPVYQNQPTYQIELVRPPAQPVVPYQPVKPVYDCKPQEERQTVIINEIHLPESWRQPADCLPAPSPAPRRDCSPPRTDCDRGYCPPPSGGQILVVPPKTAAPLK
ncbi:MAG: hypothetical protein BWY65_02338 [Firmicutes bacterium ADurb.Bin373]|nr:MAG: hypothetical protein BWY65_02338 [Firmicutes bacterium ADurb.Bin373]